MKTMRSGWGVVPSLWALLLLRMSDEFLSRWSQGPWTIKISSKMPFLVLLRDFLSGQSLL